MPRAAVASRLAMGMALPCPPPCPHQLWVWGLRSGTTRFGVQEGDWCPLQPAMGPTSQGPPARPGATSQRHFHLESRLPAPSAAPPGWGARGAASCGGAGGLGPDACAQPACPLHRILRWQENPQLSWKPSSKRSKDAGKRRPKSGGCRSPSPLPAPGDAPRPRLGPPGVPAGSLAEVGAAPAATGHRDGGTQLKP